MRLVKAPKISIIIPVYNIQDYVEGALQSACSQTLSDIEIIVIDDASTDNSAAVVERYAEEDPRIVFLRHEKNKSLGATRNMGIRAAKARYIMFFDGDDTIKERDYFHNL